MHIENIAWTEPHEMFHAFAHVPFALLLDSATAKADTAPFSRWSFIALDPFDTVTIDNKQTSASNVQNPFDTLRNALELNSIALPNDPALPPFTGGAAGFFSYDLARYLERLPDPVAPFAIDDQSLPAMAIGLYDTIIAFDHHQHRAQIISNGLPETSPEARTTRARHRAHDLLLRLNAGNTYKCFQPKPGQFRSAF